MHVLRLMVRLTIVLGCIFLTYKSASAADGVRIPRVSSPPLLEVFEDMKPSGNSSELA